MNINPRIRGFLTTGLLSAREHSPIILTGVGVVGVIAAGVLAARATLKLEKTVDIAQQRLELADGTDVEHHKTAKTKAVTANVLDLVKLYGPSVTLGAASLVCIVSAQGILHKRNAALVVAYKGLEQAYNKYRERVVEEYGPEVDRDFHLGLRDKVVKNPETGKDQKVKVKIDEDDHSPYVAIFGPDNDNWVGVHEHNEFFLTSQQNYLNDQLRLTGVVFLNDVHKRLGLPLTKAGALTGWVYNVAKNEKYEGTAGYIDFRMVPLHDEPMAKDLGWPESNHWMLDFNVDGLIYDLLPETTRH